MNHRMTILKDRKHFKDGKGSILMLNLKVNRDAVQKKKQFYILDELRMLSNPAKPSLFILQKGVYRCGHYAERERADLEVTLGRATQGNDKCGR